MTTEESTYYSLLEVGETATPAEIKTAYRRLAREYHPDTIPEGVRERRIGREAAAKFRLLTDAYNVLVDPRTRDEYDNELRVRRQRARPSTPRPPQTSAPPPPPPQDARPSEAPNTPTPQPPSSASPSDYLWGRHFGFVIVLIAIFLLTILVSAFFSIPRKTAVGQVNNSRQQPSAPAPLGWSDVWLSSVYSYGSDYGVDDEKLQVGGWGDSYYTLISFETPPSQQEHTELRLYALARGDQSVPPELYLDRVTEPWDESVGWKNQPAAVEVRRLPAPTANSWYRIDITDLVEGWHSHKYPNYGIRLRPTSTTNKFAVFASSRARMIERRPVLHLTYNERSRVAPGEFIAVPQPELPRRIREDLERRVTAGEGISIPSTLDLACEFDFSGGKHPFFATGDFDDDGKDDHAVVLDRDRIFGKVLVYFASGQIEELRGEELIFTNRHRGMIDTWDGKATLTRDSIMGIACNKSGRLYQYSSTMRKFQTYVVSD